VIAVVITVGVTAIGLALILHRRHRAIISASSDVRLAAMAERAAARNGRPAGHVVGIYPSGHRY
jgi:hypothetical protein